MPTRTWLLYQPRRSIATQVRNQPDSDIHETQVKSVAATTALGTSARDHCA
jgi:hypothetical protein